MIHLCMLSSLFGILILFTRSYGFSSSSVYSRLSSCPLYLDTGKSDNDGSPPSSFVIERLEGNTTSQGVLNDIAEVWTEAFYNDDKGNNISPWRQIQLAYLRSIQSTDLKQRKLGEAGHNAMFVARINNKKNLGKIVGFVEVNERAYGLVGDESLDNRSNNTNSSQQHQENDDKEHMQQWEEQKEQLEREQEEWEQDQKFVSMFEEEEQRQTSTSSPPNTLRPVLSNLAVTAELRKSGIGSRLIEACENEASENWNAAEIILEVEVDNLEAIEFYKKRGYEALFTDQACRRFNTEGFFLKKERCAKICMRKELESSKNKIDDSSKVLQESS